jgi:peptidoglycan/xylan/chitin deacetylase (PgdA/CDA1 family)
MSAAAGSVVLMYHAVPDGVLGPDDADPHYSVSMAQFRAHLRLFADLGLRPSSVRDLLPHRGLPSASRGLALTFDDGHQSNFAAFAELAAHGGSADFFINPMTVGATGYLTWAQLREMAAAGASIQSHGLNHVFLDELPAAKVEMELALSRRRIEDQLGQPAELFAPPNGRMPAGLTQQARELGYSAICSSRPGVWLDPHAAEIARVAVLAATSTATLEGWLRRSPWTIGPALVRASLLRSGKRLLGNGRYMAVRRALLREHRAP